MENAKDLLLSGGQLRLKVTPRASRNAIEGWMQDAEGALVLKVKVTAVPEDGEANRAVIALLAEQFGLAKSRLSLARGAAGRFKVVCYA